MKVLKLQHLTMESIAINWVSKWEVQGPIRPYLPQGEKDMKMMMTRSKSLWFVLYNFQSHGVSNHPHLSLPVPLPETPILDCKVFFFGGGGGGGRDGYRRYCCCIFLGVSPYCTSKADI